MQSSKILTIKKLCRKNKENLHFALHLPRSFNICSNGRNMLPPNPMDKKKRKKSINKEKNMDFKKNFGQRDEDYRPQHFFLQNLGYMHSQSKRKNYTIIIWKRCLDIKKGRCRTMKKLTKFNKLLQLMKAIIHRLHVNLPSNQFTYQLAN